MLAHDAMQERLERPFGRLRAGRRGRYAGVPESTAAMRYAGFVPDEGPRNHARSAAGPGTRAANGRVASAAEFATDERGGRWRPANGSGRIAGEGIA